MATHPTTPAANPNTAAENPAIRATPTPLFAPLAFAELYAQLDHPPLAAATAKRLRHLNPDHGDARLLAEHYRSLHTQQATGGAPAALGAHHSHLAGWVLAGHAHKFPSKKLQGRVRAAIDTHLGRDTITLTPAQRAAYNPAIIGWSLAGWASEATGDMVVQWALDYPDDTIATAYSNLVDHILDLHDTPKPQRTEIALSGVLVRLLGLVDALAGWPGRSAEAQKILEEAFGRQAGPVRLSYWDDFVDVVHFRNAITHLNSGGDPSYLDAVTALDKDTGWQQVVDAARPITAWMGAAIAFETRAANGVPHDTFAAVRADLGI